MNKLTKSTKLSQVQKRFVEEYIIDLNATRAAITAGYSKNTATMQASRLLTKANVNEAIRNKIKERSNRTEVTSDMVLKELALIAFFDPRNLFDDNGKLKRVSDLEPEIAKAIASIDAIKRKDGEEWVDVDKVKVNDKIRSLELLGKHLGMFTDRAVNTITVTYKIAEVNKPKTAGQSLESLANSEDSGNNSEQT